jgi:hypothetical protein
MKLLPPLLLVLAAGTGFAEDEFMPMFNGRDLTGWVNVNCAPGTWGVKDGVITCTGQPTGALRTERQYENFIMEVEWRHLTSGGNSGVFIWGTPVSAPGVPFLRGIEVQVLDHGYATQYEQRTGKKAEWFTTHGDVFPIHGATMIPLGRHNGQRSFPSEERSKPSPEWNHYRIVAHAGSIRLSVNGKEVSGGDECVYRKGYLALESEGAPVEFRQARIRELPPTGATPAQTAPEAQGHRALYSGVDLSGWRPDAPDQWASQDWRIAGQAANGTLTWEGQLGAAFELIVDCQWPKDTSTETAPPAVFLGPTRVPLPVKAGKFVRTTITVRDGQAIIDSDEATPGTTPLTGKPDNLALSNGGATGVIWANLYLRPM